MSSGSRSPLRTPSPGSISSSGSEQEDQIFSDKSEWVARVKFLKKPRGPFTVPIKDVASVKRDAEGKKYIVPWSPKSLTDFKKDIHYGVLSNHDMEKDAAPIHWLANIGALAESKDIMAAIVENAKRRPRFPNPVDTTEVESELDESTRTVTPKKIIKSIRSRGSKLSNSVMDMRVERLAKEKAKQSAASELIKDYVESNQLISEISDDDEQPEKDPLHLSEHREERDEAVVDLNSRCNSPATETTPQQNETIGKGESQQQQATAVNSQVPADIMSEVERLRRENELLKLQANKEDSKLDKLFGEVSKLATVVANMGRDINVLKERNTNLGGKCNFELYYSKREFIMSWLARLHQQKQDQLLKRKRKVSDTNWALENVHSECNKVMIMSGGC